MNPPRMLMYGDEPASLREAVSGKVIDTCARCGVGIEHGAVGTVAVYAHGAIFCSSRCADAHGETCDCGCREPLKVRDLIEGLEALR
jgi:hypothetical protein